MDQVMLSLTYVLPMTAMALILFYYQDSIGVRIILALVAGLILFYVLTLIGAQFIFSSGTLCV